MKARIIAILLSFFVMSLPLHAAQLTPQPSKSPVRIDLNTVDVAKLTGSFKGIGKKRAEAIIAYRDSHSGFKSIEELAEVKGLGQKFMEKNREKLNETYVVQ